jgi:hypothetical protein
MIVLNPKPTSFERTCVYSLNISLSLKSGICMKERLKEN